MTERISKPLDNGTLARLGKNFGQRRDGSWKSCDFGLAIISSRIHKGEWRWRAVRHISRGWKPADSRTQRICPDMSAWRLESDGLGSGADRSRDERFPGPILKGRARALQNFWRHIVTYVVQ